MYFCTKTVPHDRCARDRSRDSLSIRLGVFIESDWERGKVASQREGDGVRWRVAQRWAGG
jgi:hypothetical protein